MVRWSRSEERCADNKMWKPAEYVTSQNSAGRLTHLQVFSVAFPWWQVVSALLGSAARQRCGRQRPGDERQPQYFALQLFAEAATKNSVAMRAMQHGSHRRSAAPVIPLQTVFGPFRASLRETQNTRRSNQASQPLTFCCRRRANAEAWGKGLTVRAIDLK